MLHSEKTSIISIIHFNNFLIIKRINMIDSFLKSYLSYFYCKKRKRLGDAVPPSKKIEVGSPLYVSILLLFSFHLSGNKFLYTFMSVFGGSFAALLITSVIYSKVFIPCILHEQASE